MFSSAVRPNCSFRTAGARFRELPRELGTASLQLLLGGHFDLLASVMRAIPSRFSHHPPQRLRRTARRREKRKNRKKSWDSQPRLQSSLTLRKLVLSRLWQSPIFSQLPAANLLQAKCFVSWVMTGRIGGSPHFSLLHDFCHGLLDSAFRERKGPPRQIRVHMGAQSRVTNSVTPVDQSFLCLVPQALETRGDIRQLQGPLVGAR